MLRVSCDSFRRSTSYVRRFQLPFAIKDRDYFSSYPLATLRFSTDESNIKFDVLIENWYIRFVMPMLR